MSTSNRPDYQIHIDDGFGALKLIDISADVADCTEPFFDILWRCVS